MTNRLAVIAMFVQAIIGIVLAVALSTTPALAQQRADLGYKYHIDQPAFAPGHGPSVAIDAGHHNFHTASGRFKPFADLISADGFQVASISGPFDAQALAGYDVLVIANALNAANHNRWILPTPSAFSSQEIETVRLWVEEGGSLLLIADHMPFAGAAAKLAHAFEFAFVNGYAVKVADRSMKFSFSPGNGLDDAPLGGVGLSPVDRFVTSVGQAIKVPETAHSLLTLIGDHVALLPIVADEFDAKTPIFRVSGYSQGAVRAFGKGRVAVFGEASAFTAQLSRSGKKMGMNATGAENNALFVLKVIRWLVRYRPQE